MELAKDNIDSNLHPSGEATGQNESVEGILNEELHESIKIEQKEEPKKGGRRGKTAAKKQTVAPVKEEIKEEKPKEIAKEEQSEEKLEETAKKEIKEEKAEETAKEEIKEETKEQTTESAKEEKSKEHSDIPAAHHSDTSASHHSDVLVPWSEFTYKSNLKDIEQNAESVLGIAESINSETFPQILPIIRSLLNQIGNTQVKMAKYLREITEHVEKNTRH